MELQSSGCTWSVHMLAPEYHHLWVLSSRAAYLNSKSDRYPLQIPSRKRTEVKNVCYKLSSSVSSQHHSFCRLSERNIGISATMEANNVPLIRRSATQRHSIRSSKRLMRSTSGTSPLARNLLRTLHEQKRAALAEQRARRWELYSVVNQHVLLEPKSIRAIEKEDDEEEDQLVPSLVPTNVHEARTVASEEPTMYTASDARGKSGKKKGLMRFRTVKKHVSQVVTRMFVRKTDKRQVASTGTDDSGLTAFRRYPSTEL